MPKCSKNLLMDISRRKRYAIEHQLPNEEAARRHRNKGKRPVNKADVETINSIIQYIDGNKVLVTDHGKEGEIYYFRNDMSGKAAHAEWLAMRRALNKRTLSWDPWATILDSIPS